MTLAGFLMALWVGLPLKPDLPWAALLALIAAALGALVWHPVLILLKRHGWEPDSTDPYGGRNEARLAGGAAIGLTYYFPLAVLLTFVDVKAHRLPWSEAIWANSAFLFGSTTGGALFYGLRIRSCTYLLGWSHLKQESVLVLLWSALLFGIGLLGYALARAIATRTSLLDAAMSAALVATAPVLLCYFAVGIFILTCVTSQNLREDVRGVVVGVVSMFSLTLAHELYWVGS